MLNFDKIGIGNVANTALPPREIFQALPKKDNFKFQYPRDVQSEVWSKWFEKRNDKNVVIKMNTGGGKTIVGLILLKSCLNEKKGPAVYVVPDNYLVKQVMAEGEKLGIGVTNDEDSIGFLTGKDILVINIYKLINGKSKFGVGDEGKKIPIGSIIIDDAHACLNTVESQFTIKIKFSDDKNGLFRTIFNLFAEDIARQNYIKYSEILNGDYTAMQEIPFWNWQRKIKEITEILVKNRTDDELKFTLPLLKNHLSLCKCVISSQSIEITPHIIPISVFPSLDTAFRKIYMTATLADDSILSTHFGVNTNELNNAITPDSAGDIGERMILLPQVLNPKITDKDLIEICSEVAKSHNVVIICPSEYKAKKWFAIANQMLKTENITEGVDKLKNSHVGVTILLNRYDGIDLPKEACRLLVIDGLPDDSSNIEKIKNGILLGSKEGSIRTIQKIEQGMGRGIRSNDDYCVVMLLGQQLSSLLYVNDAASYFSPATKAQLDLSNQIADQLTTPSNEQILEVMNYCLSRNDQWIAASRGGLSALKYEGKESSDNLNSALFNAFKEATLGDYRKAYNILYTYINKCDDNKTKGYAKQFLAEYTNFYDEGEAQKILKSAKTLNQRVLRPLDGITYDRINQDEHTQALKVSEYIRSKFDEPNKVIIYLNSLLDDLNFKPESHKRFESAIDETAKLLGFSSERPEEKYDEGPDNLWAIKANEYLVIECKNEAINEKITKYYCNQLTGSLTWFNNNYDHFCKATPILIHPSTTTEKSASLSAGTRIIDAECLEKLKNNLHSFITCISYNNELANIDKIRERLSSFKLKADDLIPVYTKEFR
ncbi:DEAD/DEAH box helicase [Cronobacter malonaticus]|uniref:DEAD/DEAH box helicase n=1 Tax=Cronobacter malonaticus TaxID=413503 RepID=UPI0013757F45|nr:DEAD/DEAH box helicase family protein [Cronobacter malonaticus]NCH84207.1 DEAD/DEAH box helicase [Cronobacter malonaticus]